MEVEHIRPQSFKETSQKNYMEIKTKKLFEHYFDPHNEDYLSLQQIYNIVDINELKESRICSICEKKFYKHLDFALHSIDHSEKRLFSCHLCNSEMSQEKTLRNHMETHERLQCTTCGKSMRNRKFAHRHSSSHLFESELVKCRLCGKQLRRIDSKDHRIRAHQGSTPGAIKCSVCDKEYLSRSSLKRHYSFQHKEFGINTSKVCDICGKVCSNTQKLQEHMRTHTGDKPFECAHCPKKFMTKQVLKKHMRSHTGEKPLVCKFCGKKFKYDGGYRYHLKTHTGEKSHCCPICGRAFISKSNMKVHVKGCEGSNCR